MKYSKLCVEFVCFLCSFLLRPQNKRNHTLTPQFSITPCQHYKMNFLKNIFQSAATTTSLISNIVRSRAAQGSFTVLNNELAPAPFLSLQERFRSLWQMHRQGPIIKKRKPKKILDGNPFMKGVVLKTLIKKPKKPNSANRKCVLVRLSNGKEMISYVPGIGHNLQEHSIVLCRVGRLKDCPGVKIKCVRGKYDLGHVIVAKK